MVSETEHMHIRHKCVYIDNVYEKLTFLKSHEIKDNLFTKRRVMNVKSGGVYKKIRPTKR
jgi:hypothetical protein